MPQAPNFQVPGSFVGSVSGAGCLVYIEGQDLNNYRETQQFPQWASTLATVERKNSLIIWKKSLAEPDSMWAAIYLDRLGWAGKNRGERRDGRKRGERRERPGTLVAEKEKTKKTEWPFTPQQEKEGRGRW